MANFPTAFDQEIAALAAKLVEDFEPAYAAEVSGSAYALSEEEIAWVEKRLPAGATFQDAERAIELAAARRADGKVLVAGRAFDMDAVRALMDDELCEQIHNHNTAHNVRNDQQMVDAYLPLHRAKFGAEFCVN